MFRVKNILLLIVFLSVTACGYHLRSDANLPEGMKKILLQGASSQLQETMKKRLKPSGGQLVETPAEAGIVVRVDKEKMDRRVFSLSSSGRANEYELIFNLDISLFDVEGNSLADKQKIEVSRNYFNNQDDILAKNNEELVIQDEMYKQAVQAIINRSRIALEKLNKK